MARNKFDVDERLEAQFDMEQLKRLMTYVKPFIWKVIITVFVMLLSSLAALIGPILVMDAIDNRIEQGDMQGLLILVGIFVVTLVVSAICLKYRIKLMSDVGQSVVRNIRSDLFVHLQKLPFTYYDSRPHGKILVRVVNYVNALSDLLSNGLINIITDLFSLFVIIGFMLVIDVRLTLICMIGLPIVTAVILVLKNAQRKAWQDISSKQSNLNAYIHESICGMKVTQSFAREEENLKIFRELSTHYQQSWMHAMKLQNLIWPIVENVSVVAVSVIYVVGIASIGSGITVGALVAFVGYIWRFWMPILNLGNFYNAIITAIAYLERIFETLDEQPTVKNLPNASKMPEIVGNVTFEDVSFCYEKNHPILKKINFNVQEGDSIALVGPTGAGKTTVINLLSRFYDIDEGTIYIDGIDIKQVTLESLRKQMGVMLQDTFIFSGTIMDNIRYSRLDATNEEVIEAAKAVKAHDFIMTLQEGYDTQVNERGSRLSVGQRQLISFARALLADPKILILDEATANIDTETEVALQKGLETLLKGRTSFVIAHRLSTIKNASQIMYIDQGDIIERGTHDELIKQKGAYWELYMSQYSFLEAM